MITPNSGIAPFLAPNRNKLTVPFKPLLGLNLPNLYWDRLGNVTAKVVGPLS